MLMELPIYQVDAFTSRPFGGNPAAVCPLNEWLDEALMQRIAQENNQAETAFFVLDEEPRRIRWFTPAMEVELCGHATLASAFIAYTELGCREDAITFDSKGGEIAVSRKNGAYELDFPSIRGEAAEPEPALLRGLRKEPEECLAASNWLCVFKDEDMVRRLDPDFSELATLAGRGVIVAAPGESCDFVSRFFAPNYGINEDQATGSAHCMLTPYWANRLGKAHLNARQISQRVGEFKCEDRGGRVGIAGGCHLYMRGSIFV